jgi:hypothetical protein
MEAFLTLDALESGAYTGWLTRPSGGLTWRQTAEVVPGTPRRGVAGSQTGPWLVSASDSGGERYAVMRERQLLTDFDKLAMAPSRDRVLQVASQYGWLDGPRRLREPGTVWGESYGRWRGELAVWRTTRELWRAACAKDRRVLNKQIRWTADSLCWAPHGDEGPRWLIADDRIRTPFEQRMLFGDFSRGDLVGPARWIVLRTVNEKLYDRVGMLVVPFRSRLRSFPKTLLGALYLRFAIELAGGRRERPCDKCGLPFAAGRSDKRYCSRECQNSANYQARRTGKPSVSSPVSNDVSSTPV